MLVTFYLNNTNHCVLAIGASKVGVDGRQDNSGAGYDMKFFQTSFNGKDYWVSISQYHVMAITV
jgi:hypothetical protein